MKILIKAIGVFYFCLGAGFLLACTLMSAFGHKWGASDAGTTLAVIWAISFICALIYVCNERSWKN